MSDWDAIVVGGGHNGLVAAFYLAKAGLKTLVLERREIVGGACVTEEFAPGFHASSGAYVLSMLRPQVWEDFRLAQRGLAIDPAGPSLHLFDDGQHLLVHEDEDALADELSRFSQHDARQIARFESELARVGALITPFIDWTPPDVASSSPANLALLLRYGLRGARHRREIDDALWAFAASASQFLDEWFEDEHVKAAFGWHAINDSLSGPSTPGTAYVLLHDHAADDASGGIRAWGFVRGGIGRVTELMADAAREQGAQIRTQAEVQEILVEGDGNGGAARGVRGVRLSDGAARGLRGVRLSDNVARGVRGVRLSDGETIEAPLVLSNADPQRTLLHLLGERWLDRDIAARLAAYRCQGTSMKISLGVNALPRIATIGDRPGVLAEHHRGIMEITGTLADLDRAQDEARAGRPAHHPHIELCIPTVHDPSLAPPGMHIVTIDVNSQPYRLAEGSWDQIKEQVADAAIARIAAHIPELPQSIVAREVLSPLDLERRFNMTGGHPLHGDMGFDQLFTLRPVRGMADYRTPVSGLYLCGAGTHPGGGVTGANGRNCAREVLRDRHLSARRGRLAALAGRVAGR